MKRYAALLRGVSPMNLKMADLKRSLEAAGFTDVRTVLSSGNAVFTVERVASEQALAGKAEQAMEETLGRTFMTIVRPVSHLAALVERDPFSEFELPDKAKRVVTFLPDPADAKTVRSLKLPIELDGAQILAAKGGEVFSAYVPSPKGPVFMGLIEKTFGKDVTTRTWDTVKKLTR